MSERNSVFIEKIAYFAKKIFLSFWALNLLFYVLVYYRLQERVIDSMSFIVLSYLSALSLRILTGQIMLREYRSSSEQSLKRLTDATDFLKKQTQVASFLFALWIMMQQFLFFFFSVSLLFNFVHLLAFSSLGLYLFSHIKVLENIEVAIETGTQTQKIRKPQKWLKLKAFSTNISVFSMINLILFGFLGFAILTQAVEDDVKELRMRIRANKNNSVNNLLKLMTSKSGIEYSLKTEISDNYLKGHIKLKEYYLKENLSDGSVSVAVPFSGGLIEYERENTYLKHISVISFLLCFFSWIVLTLLYRSQMIFVKSNERYARLYMNQTQRPEEELEPTNKSSLSGKAGIKRSDLYLHLLTEIEKLEDSSDENEFLELKRKLIFRLKAALPKHVELNQFWIGLSKEIRNAGLTDIEFQMKNPEKKLFAKLPPVYLELLIVYIYFQSSSSHIKFTLSVENEKAEIRWYSDIRSKEIKNTEIMQYLQEVLSIYDLCNISNLWFYEQEYPFVQIPLVESPKDDTENILVNSKAQNSLIKMLLSVIISNTEEAPINYE